jgi:hypothetical protein
MKIRKATVSQKLTIAKPFVGIEAARSHEKIQGA